MCGPDNNRPSAGQSVNDKSLGLIVPLHPLGAVVVGDDADAEVRLAAVQVRHCPREG